MDFFRDSDDTYDDFTQTLDEILKKYQSKNKELNDMIIYNNRIFVNVFRFFGYFFKEYFQA